MSLEDLARVVISTEGPALTQVGFGTLLIAAQFAGVFGASELVRTYTSLTAAVADFATTTPVYKALARAFAQNPRPARVKVGRRALFDTQTVKFGVAATQNSSVYSFVMTRNGVSATITYTSDASATVLEIVTGLAAAVEASTLAATVAATVSDTNTKCQIVEGTPGQVTYYSNWTSNLNFADVTTDPGIATDLAAIRAYDSDWYGLGLDHDCLAVSKQASIYIETLNALYAANVSDTDATDSGVSTDLGAYLKSTSTGRTMVFFDLDDTGGYSGIGALAERFPFDPGQPSAGGTWHGKTISGVTADALSDTQKTNLRAKNYVVYITTAGRAHILDGKVAGGEFADVVRGLDWFKIRSEEGVAGVILNNQKVPYTDRGINMLKTAVDAVGAVGERNELFTPGTYKSTAPKNSEVLSADRKARKLTGLSGTAQLAGAIHLVDPISFSVT